MNLPDRQRLASALARAGVTRLIAGGAAVVLALTAIVGLATLGGDSDDGENAAQDVPVDRSSDRVDDAPETGSNADISVDTVTGADPADGFSGDEVAGPASLSGAKSAGASSSPPAATGSDTSPANAARGSEPDSPPPLGISESGWAEASTSQNGWVPPHGLPVAANGGEIDRMSFFRLDGAGTVLKLGILSRESGPLNNGAGAVACAITADSWKAAPRQQLSRAPAYDGTNCVNGKRLDRTTMTFDLGGFPERVGGRGFVLIPKGPLGATFEIVFSRAVRA